MPSSSVYETSMLHGLLNRPDITLSIITLGMHERERYTASRITRQELLVLLENGQLPGPFMLSNCKSGKIFLRNHPNITVSTSYRKKYGIVGFVEGCSLGVDVESISTADLIWLYRRKALSKHESSCLANFPELEQRSLLTAIWSVKEAFGKCIGVGLGLPFRHTYLFSIEDMQNLVAYGKFHAARSINMGLGGPDLATWGTHNPSQLLTIVARRVRDYWFSVVTLDNASFTNG